MAREYLAVVDVGTTNCKASLFDIHGTLVDSESREVQNIYNRLGPGWVEIDIRHLWDSVCYALRNLTGRNVDKADLIMGISLTTLRQSIVAVDRDGEPIRNMIPWCVKSTSAEANWIRENIGEDYIFNRTGLTIDPLWSLPSMLYIMRKEKDIFQRTYKILEAQDYLIRKLGVEEFVTDYSQASCLSIFDIHTLSWSDSILDKVGLPVEMLPKVVAPGTIAGAVSKQASEITGLTEGCPIILAGGDSQCSALGCGAVKEGSAAVVIGTSAVGMVFSQNALLDPKKRLVTHAHSYPDKYILEHQTLTGGVAFKWYRDQFCRLEVKEAAKTGIDPYVAIDKGVMSSPPGANGTLFLPHFVGAASPFWNDNATGVLMGMNLGTTREDIGRAIIEGIALEVKRGFDIMDQIGLGIDEVRISGGGSKADSPWPKVQADVYGKPVHIVNTNETTALGAAIMCANSLKQYPSIVDAMKGMVKVETTIEPDRENGEFYTSLLSLQEKVYQSLNADGVYTQFASLRKEMFDKKR